MTTTPSSSNPVPARKKPPAPKAAARPAAPPEEPADLPPVVSSGPLAAVLEEVCLDLPLQRRFQAGSLLARILPAGSASVASAAPAAGSTGETGVGGRVHTHAGHGSHVTILDGVSFTLHHQERLALIGHNGAGKSSLLRVMGGIYQPSRGSCRIRGRVSTLFNSALGLNAEATGAENVLLAGTLLGIPRTRLPEVMADVIAFTELGEFFDAPLRTYSSGMKTRLGFAIATAIHPDVLLIDEVFGAGDRHFQKKARRRLEDTLQQASTLVLASHAEAILRDFCTRAIWLDHGRIRMDGPLNPVLKAYRESA